jgi:hypothetical protein
MYTLCLQAKYLIRVMETHCSSSATGSAACRRGLHNTASSCLQSRCLGGGPYHHVGCLCWSRLQHGWLRSREPNEVQVGVPVGGVGSRSSLAHSGVGACKGLASVHWLRRGGVTYNMIQDSTRTFFHISLTFLLSFAPWSRSLAPGDTDPFSRLLRHPWPY